MKKVSQLKVAAVAILAVIIAALVTFIVLFKVWSGNGGLSEEKMKSNISAAGKVYKTISHERADNSYTGKTKDKDSFVISESDSIESTDKKSDKTAKDTSDTTDTDYICSYSASRALTDEDISELKKGKYDNLPAGKDIIQMVINEMYARHGYEFKNEDVQAYFDSKKWYKDVSEHNDNMDDIYKNMSDIERKNIDFLSEYKEG